MAAISNGTPHRAAVPPPDDSRAIVGYFCAVNTATISAMIVFARVASRDPDFSRLGVGLTAFIHGFFFWLFTLFTAALPFALSYVVARWLRIGYIIYYLASGAVIGAVLTPLYIWHDVRDYPGRPLAPPPFLEAYMRTAPIFLAIGAVASATFWYKAGRHLSGTRRQPSTNLADAIFKKAALGIVWALCLAIPAYVVAPLVELLLLAN